MIVEQIKPANWTPEEALAHLRLTFESACMGYPELMERYVVMRVEAQDPTEEMAIMREALRSTLADRYPYFLQTTPPRITNGERS